MKFARLNSAFALLAVLSMASLSTAWAQDGNGRSAEEILARQRVKQLTSLFQLNPEQKGKVEVIVLDEFKQVAQVKGDDNIPLQDKFAKQDAIRTESKAKIKAELTSEQLAKWDELEKKGKKPKK